MYNKSIIFKNFNFKNKRSNQLKNILKYLKKILEDDNHIIKSLKNDYKNSYDKKSILRLKKFDQIKLIGMGGSILGSRAIYDFLKPKFKKIFFIDNFKKKKELNKRFNKNLNIIISKSGNTLETLSNANVHINKKDFNVFLTENQESYLIKIAKKLKAEVIHHNNYIGGRYSVLSEVGMLPAELMGFKPHKFRRLNQLISNKNFIESLIQNVSNILNLIKLKKYNSIILNYDDDSESLFRWYQQLVAESLGKKGNGILPVISSMPRDNHSLMQHYLDGKKDNFFTFFYVKDNYSKKIKNNQLLDSHSFLKGKNLNDISFSQFTSSQKVFTKKKIPFRSFIINNKNEETLGELFTFFILETILLAKVLKINPFNQPAVETIKKETKKILINS